MNKPACSAHNPNRIRCQKRDPWGRPCGCPGSREESPSPPAGPCPMRSSAFPSRHANESNRACASAAGGFPGGALGPGLSSGSAMAQEVNVKLALGVILASLGIHSPVSLPPRPPAPCGLGPKLRPQRYKWPQEHRAPDGACQLAPPPRGVDVMSACPGVTT